MAEKGDIPNTLAGLLQSKSRNRRSRSAVPDKQPQLGFAFASAPAEAPQSRPSPPSPPASGLSLVPLPAAAAVPAEYPVAAPVPQHENRVWTVRALVSTIRQQVERGFLNLWVEGEISNCRPAPSGHIYFTLKDGEAQLPIVLFRKQAQLLRFRPKDGLAVKVRGNISVYESRGQLQLIAETVEELGAGALQRAFDQLKARLRAEGLFDRPKQPLPAFPQCVGVVTSTSGAVLRDIVTVIRRRHAHLNLLIFPASMQGPNCARTVGNGIRWFNAHPGRVDLIILARGGGSIEDLAGFNDEALARTIAASSLPVVSAIGHETDFTIADFVADLRAPTPSAAAELVTSAQHRIEERVLSLARRVHRAGSFQLMEARHRLSRLSAEHVLGRVQTGIHRREQRVDELRFRLASASDRLLRTRTSRLDALEARLRRHDPRLRLALAQGRLTRADEALARTSVQLISTRHQRLARFSAEHLLTRVQTGIQRREQRVDELRFRLAAASDRLLRLRTLRLDALGARLRRQDPRLLLASSQRRLSRADEALARASAHLVVARRHRLERVTSRLEALSPLAVLNRGYALVYNEASGTLLRSADQAHPGQTIRARLAQGTVRATISEKQNS